MPLNEIVKNKPNATSPPDQQVGGSHYKNFTIQPVEFIHDNGLGFCEGNIIKYVSRWKDKCGIEDLLKARHYINLLIALEIPENGKVENLKGDGSGAALPPIPEKQLASDINQLDLEKSILSAALMDPEAFKKAWMNYPKDYFKTKAHRTIYFHLCQLAGDGQRIDLQHLTFSIKQAQKLQDVGGEKYLKEISRFNKHNYNIVGLFDLLKRYATEDQG